MEALAGLMRLSVEALDEQSIGNWDYELDRFMNAYPRQIPPMAWYCKGAVARHRGQWMLAQRCFHRYLRAVKTGADADIQVVRGWVMLAVILQHRNRVRRALWLAEEILRRFEEKNLRCMNGIIYLLLGSLYERQKDFDMAMKWFQKAHAQFLGDHNWYYHLYVLFGYARIARQQQNYPQAYWYLDLVDKAASAPEFALLKRDVMAERCRLKDAAIDLLIDSSKGVVKTREVGPISLRKQYVLLHILEALSQAHKERNRSRKKVCPRRKLLNTSGKSLTNRRFMIINFIIILIG